MIDVREDLYVVIEQLETTLAPQPKPLNHGFSKDVSYLVLGAFSLSESSDAFFILSNDHDEIWFISNRHLRTYKLLPGATAFRLPVTSALPRRAKAPRARRRKSLAKPPVRRLATNGASHH
ncbi:MAG: hypothetical protein H0X40_05495 [Chthoniobacterales bacterium]|nr:hypothetical protein [Chthoniobacterales bacterium]